MGTVNGIIYWFNGLVREFNGVDRHVNGHSQILTALDRYVNFSVVKRRLSPTYALFFMFLYSKEVFLSISCEPLTF